MSQKNQEKQNQKLIKQDYQFDHILFKQKHQKNEKKTEKFEFTNENESWHDRKMTWERKTRSFFQFLSCHKV